MRYLPLDASDRAAMLARVGVSHIDALFSDIPEDKRLAGLIDMPLGQSEIAVERAMSAMAGRNVAAGSQPFFLGAGAYRHHIPASVDHLIQRSEFLASYTPYQPEIAQGTLQTLFEFQT
jgi:glycine dehydrogenase subunit 1